MRFAVVAVLLILLGLWTWRKPRQASVILWSLMATLFCSAALLKILPGAFRDNVIWYAATLPLIWAAVMTWVYWAPKPHRASAILIAITGLSGVVIAIAPSPV